MENICNPETKEGEWVTKLDLSIDKKAEIFMFLSIKNMGHCKRECQTIVRVCKKNVEEITLELSEALWKRKINTKEKWILHVCKKWIQVFPNKREDRKLLPLEYNRKDESFKEKTDQD